MTENQQSDLAWLGWIEVMRKVASFTQNGEFTTALSEIEAFLSRETRAELRSEALSLRADLKEQLGDLEAAKEDLLTARSLVGRSYMRYVQELSLGRLYRMQQRLNEAVSWYRVALHTCIEGEGISGGTALKEFLTLRGQEALTVEDQALTAQVAERSWRVLGLPGQPDLTSLPRVISAIKDGEANPPRKG